MKKALVVIVILVTIIGAYFLWLKWSSNKFIDGFYLVPNDAVMVIETEDPIGHWQRYSASNLWQGIRRFPALAKITRKADLMDEIIKSNQQVFELLGQKHLIISIHMTKTKDYDFVYYADMKEASKSDLIKASLKSLIKQFDYKLTVRNYQKVEVNEFLDEKTRDVLSVAFINNYLVCSYNKLLINRVIETSQLPELQTGMDSKFTEVNQLTAADGMCRLFINYKTFQNYLGVYIEDVSGISSLLNGLNFTGLDINFKNDHLLADGYSMINDSLNSYVLALSKSGKSISEADKIFSNRTSFFLSMGYSDFNVFQTSLQSSLGKDSKSYIEENLNLKKIERTLNINIQKNITNWIGTEIAIAQYETDLLIGNKVKSIMAIKVNNLSYAKENLNFIEKQMRKRSPIRFSTVMYKGYEIKYLEVKGLFKSILGNLFSKFDKPYYTILGDFVVLSDDPKTLLLTIDDFISQETLSNKVEYRNFRSKFSEKTSVLAYLSPNHYFENFKGILNSESWKSTQKNQSYIRCFEHVGLSLTGDGDRMRTVIGANYMNWKAPIEVVDTSDDEKDTLSVMDLFLIKNFQGNFNTVYYENGNPKSSTEMEGHLKDGIHIEYYENRVIKIKGKYKHGKRDGTWKYYLPDGRFDRREKYVDGILKKQNVFQRLLNEFDI